MIDYIRLFRPRHYIKNILIFLPLVFGGRMFSMPDLVNAFAAFAVFSMSASFVYIINDIMDRELDKNHPIKQKRPIASGRIPVQNAISAAILLLLGAGAFSMAFLSGIGWVAMAIPVIYILINMIYSLWGKNIPVLDIFILATGFILRVVYGGLATGIAISDWLYLTIFSMSFYLGLGKRRNEINLSGDTTRKVLQGYSYHFLDKNMYVFLTAAIVFYALWCINFSEVNGDSGRIIFSVPLVMLICMKYSLTIEGDSIGDPIEVFLKDKVLILLAGIYGLFMLFILY